MSLQLTLRHQGVKFKILDWASDSGRTRGPVGSEYM